MINTRNIERIRFNSKIKKQSTKQFLLFKDVKGKDNELVECYLAMTGGGFALHCQREIEFSTFLLENGVNISNLDISNIRLPKEDEMTTTKFVVQVLDSNSEFIIHSTTPVGMCDHFPYRILCKNMPGIISFEPNDRYSVKAKIGHAFQPETVLENLCGLISVFNVPKPKNSTN